ncbi:MAG: hypothetical protein JNM26_04165 [Ideonella sp.]|nr:hypothetical protein [Ideonella sp.]
MPFIQLTYRHDRPRPLWVRSEAILSVIANDGGEGTIVGMPGESFEIVTETPEEVLALIGAAETSTPTPSPAGIPSPAPESRDDP